jgi:hypothetical protein
MLLSGFDHVYGHIGVPLEGKTFQKSVSMVIDNLELFYSIIEQIAPN